MQLVVSCKIMSYMNGKSKRSFLFTAKMRILSEKKCSCEEFCWFQEPKFVALFLSRLRHSSGRLNGEGEASFFLDISTSNSPCGFLHSLQVYVCVCVNSLYTTLRFRQNCLANYMTTKKMIYAVQINNWKQQNKWTTIKKQLFNAMLKLLLAEYCTYSRLQDYLQLWELIFTPASRCVFSSDKDSYC